MPDGARRRRLTGGWRRRLGPHEREAAQVITSLWRGVVVLRVATFLFAVGVVLVYVDEYVRPALGWMIVAVMAVWTVVVVACYSRDAGRRGAVVLADLTLTLALMAGSGLVLTPEQLTEPIPLVSTVWAPGPIVAAAGLSGRLGGLVAGGLVAGMNILVRGHVDVEMARDTVLALCLGFVLGLSSHSARRSEAQLRMALRAEATTAERERLARSIHDSVLQVLAHIRRRGASLGGEAAELARLAGEQEIALRTLVSARPAGVDGMTDLRSPLELLATSRVQVSVPATAVLLPAATAAELAAVAAEALSNVDKHAGAQARAWVLLEDLGDQVVLTVRDDGCGIADGRLATAAGEGRLGVAHSMRGRVAGLGGSIELHSHQGDGTEWEVRVPK